jgi:hypothetical protein
MLGCCLLEQFGIVNAAMNFVVISGLRPIGSAARGISQCVDIEHGRALIEAAHHGLTR